MKAEIRSSCFYFLMNKIVVLALFCLAIPVVTQAQTLSERTVTTISPAPPVVVPAKRVTVSQALRFGEQAEPRPETLARRSDLPVMSVRQPVMFDYDFLRWELGFDKGDGYHKLRIRVTNLADLPQSFELLYAPIASRDGSAETSWRIVASQSIQPGQVFTDWQSVLIETNITRLVFLMRRRDIFAKERAVSTYSRNPDAEYPIPAAISLIADFTGDTPKVIAAPINSKPARNTPLILPAMPRLPGARNRENPDSHFRLQPFNLERTIDLPALSDEIRFELEGLRWEIQNFNQCFPSTSQASETRPSVPYMWGRRQPIPQAEETKLPITHCALRILVRVTNLSNDKRSGILMSAIPEQGNGTVRDRWDIVASFREIYPGRTVSTELSQERGLTPIYITNTTQRVVPLRWLFRAYRQLSNEEAAQTTPTVAYWKVLITDLSNQQEVTSIKSDTISRRGLIDSVDDADVSNPKEVTPRRSGTISWRGLINGVDDIVIRGSSISLRHVSGEMPGGEKGVFSVSMPDAPMSVRLVAASGPSPIRIIQAPSASNNFTTIVRVGDGYKAEGKLHSFTLRWISQ